MKKIITLFFTVSILVTNVQIIKAQTSNAEVPKPIVKSAITTLYKQLGTYLKTTDMQNAKVIPVLTEYDNGIDGIKARNAGNNAKIQQETNALSAKTMESLKKILNGEQVLKLLVAITTNDNIVNGKNLDTNQRAFIAKAK